MKNPTETGKGMADRRKASREAILSMLKDSPLEDRSPEDMTAINARWIGLQDGLRESMHLALATNGDPILAFNAALTALLTTFSTIEQTPETRDAVGYLLSLLEGLKGLENGPLPIVDGELYVTAIFDRRKEITKAVRDSYGLGDGEIEPGINIIREGGKTEENNVIDATNLFRKAGETVH